MAQAKEPQVLKELFDYAFEQSKVRVGDYKFFIQGAKSTPEGQDILWTYCRDNIKKIVGKFNSPCANSFLVTFKFAFDSHCGAGKSEDFEVWES